MTARRVRQRRDGNGNVKTGFIGVRLDPLELDLVEFLSQDPTLCKDGRPLSKSDVVRFLLKEYVHQVFQGTGTSAEQVAQYLETHRVKQLNTPL